VHKHNLDLIKKRKAGTGTLDNNVPHSAISSRVSQGVALHGKGRATQRAKTGGVCLRLQAWRTNGRPKFMKEDRFNTIQRQNKVNDHGRPPIQRPANSDS
jgi:hypothetical protein